MDGAWGIQCILSMHVSGCLKETKMKRDWQAVWLGAAVGIMSCHFLLTVKPSLNGFLSIYTDCNTGLYPPLITKVSTQTSPPNAKWLMMYRPEPSTKAPVNNTWTALNLSLLQWWDSFRCFKRHYHNSDAHVQNTQSLHLAELWMVLVSERIGKVAPMISLELTQLKQACAQAAG